MTVTIKTGDCAEVLAELPAQSSNCCVTSPPYFGLRDYQHWGQIGLEETPAEYVAKLVEVFREVRRVLTDDGTLWLNLGDSYARTTLNAGKGGGMERQGTGNGLSPSDGLAKTRLVPGFRDKNLLGIPWRVALALQSDGWNLRSDIIWHKPNPMPENVRDRPTKAHEYVFLLSKSRQYFYDPQPSSRSVWTVATKPFAAAHFATFPPELIEPCIKAGCPVGGTVLDPFGGAGTTGLVADRLQRNALLIELNPDYAELARTRICADAPLLNGAGITDTSGAAT